jgi:hypothetical protein
MFFLLSCFSVLPLTMSSALNTKNLILKALLTLVAKGGSVSLSSFKGANPDLERNSW